MFAATAPALADGKFFGRAEVADEPGILAQRAVVAFKDGVETLIVQSDVAAADATYGWLLPLPAEPTSIVACERSALSTLSAIVTPEVDDAGQWRLIPSAAVLAVILLLGFDHVRRRGRPQPHAAVWRVAFAALAIAIVFVSLLPSLSRGASAGVEVVQTARAGVYDVAVIASSSGAAARDWLAEKGFACPPAAAGVIDEYVAAGWCFVAARVAADAVGEAAHHPLKLTFPAKQAVYPLKLTGVGGQAIQLDLFVIGDERAEVAGMKVWRCDRLERSGADWLVDYATETPPVFRSRAALLGRIGIDGVTDVMWDGCVLTRLHGRLSAAGMSIDLRVGWTAFSPGRPMLFTQASAVATSGAVGLVTVGVLFASFAAQAARRGWTGGTLLRRRGLATLAVGIAAAGAVYLALDVVAIKAGSIGNTPSVSPWEHEKVLEALVDRPAGDAFPSRYAALLSKVDPNAVAIAATRFERPGDYRIEASDDGWRLTILSYYHIPVTVLIGQDGAPRWRGDE